MAKEKKIEKVAAGHTVSVEYTGKLDDGTVFDESKNHGFPLEFTAGGGKVIKGFDKAVIGMALGEQKEIKLEPADAYGKHNPQLVKKFPKDKMPKDAEIKPGMILGVGLPNGMQIPAKVTEVSKDDITLDLNNPLAGKTLNFTIKIVGIKEGGECHEGCSCGDDCCKE